MIILCTPACFAAAPFASAGGLVPDPANQRTLLDKPISRVSRR
jgi:hypothetical protein